MIKYGLSNCYGGFGYHHGIGGCNEGQFNRATGILEFKRGENLTDTIVDEVASLLTSGRLSAENRLIVKTAFNDAMAVSGPEAGLRLAQQLVAASPEFHSTNVITKSGNSRPIPDPPLPTQQDYKAVVYLMLAGGCDSFNMIIPHTCSNSNIVQQYKNIRGTAAVTGSDLTINADDQVCEKFSIHPNLPIVQELYNEEDLLFFVNTGVLTFPTNKTNWFESATPLFAHNFMQQEVQRVDPLEEASGTGVIGRISDSLERNGMSVGAFSLDTTSVALTGHPGESPSQQIISNNGINSFNPVPSIENMTSIISAINEATTADSGFFAETWSDELIRSLNHNNLMLEALDGVENFNEFPSSWLGRKLQTVAKVIATRESRGVDRDMFYLDIGGFDTHIDVNNHLDVLFRDVNDAIAAFANEMKHMNVWDSVTTIQTSEFARTLSPNGNDGTDHAWGGNYIMFGGGVKGGQIAGDYPDDLTDDGPLGLGRGRLIPTTPWDVCFRALSQWVGVKTEDLKKVCPNIDAFHEESFFSESDLFDDPDVQRARKHYLRK